MNHHNITSHLSFTYLGPPLEQGPLPALFYFALSAQDSLLLSPFNQPVIHLKSFTHTSLRIFSITIPGHELDLPKEKAIETWASAIDQGIDPITPFMIDIGHILEYLFEHDVLIKDQIAFAGLSRGGYIATMAAAKHPCCSYVLGFAPMTLLSYAKEFTTLRNHPLVHSLNLLHTLPHLTDKKIRYYIGNRDTRVGTTHAFEWITSLANVAYDARSKTGSFELFIHDSIGFMGHGTPEHIFNEGAEWIKKQLSIH